MGVFKSKKSKDDGNDQINVKDKKPKRSKDKNKKSLFGRDKQRTLIEHMQLDESVASSALAILSEQAAISDSAVRKVNDGFLIVAFDNAMLEKVELDPNGEEFGSFANSLKSETIESITLIKDLQRGVVGVIPSKETLLSLDEYDFVHDIKFKWAFVKDDLTDDDSILILDSAISIDKLFELSNDPITQFEIVDRKLRPASDVAPMNQANDVFDDSIDTVESTAIGSTLDDDDDFYGDDISQNRLSDDFDYDSDLMDDNIDDDDDDDGFDVMAESESQIDSFIDSVDESMSDDNSELIINDAFESSGNADLSNNLADQSHAHVNRLVEQTFSGDELGLTIDMSIFDDYFDSVQIAKFDTSVVGNGELELTVLKLRSDANVELTRFHQDSIRVLRNDYATIMRNTYNRLVESLDHENDATTYGRERVVIDQKYHQSIVDLDRRVIEEVELIKSAYDEERERYGESARIEALSIYDRQYSVERDRKISGVKDRIRMEIKTERDISLGELYSDRHVVASRLFDKASCHLLRDLQVKYETIIEKELAMYDTFRKDIDAYLRKHFADEVLRAKAEAEKLRQTHESERIRAEYDQMLAAKSKQLAEANQYAERSISDLDVRYKRQIDELKEQHADQLDRARNDVSELKSLLKDATDNAVKIGERKDAELQSKIKTLEYLVESKDIELTHANDRKLKSKTTFAIIVIAIASVALTLGMLLGFTYGVGRTSTLESLNSTSPNTNDSAAVYNVD